MSVLVMLINQELCKTLGSNHNSDLILTLMELIV